MFTEVSQISMELFGHTISYSEVYNRLTLAGPSVTPLGCSCVTADTVILLMLVVQMEDPESVEVLHSQTCIGRVH